MTNVPKMQITLCRYGHTVVNLQSHEKHVSNPKPKLIKPKNKTKVYLHVEFFELEIHESLPESWLPHYSSSQPQYQHRFLPNLGYA